MTLGDETLDIIARAYAEDLGPNGDLTSQAVISPGQRSHAVVVAREGGCIAGIDVASECFRYVDGEITVDEKVTNATIVDPGVVLIDVAGPTRSILTAERVALNLLGHMSGVATATRAFVDRVGGTKAAITDTRKTTPGLRSLEKAAVRAGGGVSHRAGLYDAVLIKDNHIAAAGSIAGAVAAARADVDPDIVVEVEVDTLDQLDELLTTGADRVLLDNMTPDELAEAVRRVDGMMVTEASGGVTLETVRAIAATGVDIISVGWITHSSPNLDVALDFIAED